VRAGEFVLGYENEDGALPVGPPAPLGPNGTFMVFRQFQQFPGRFTAYLDAQAPRVLPKVANRLAREWLAAKIVGRWRDGTPVALSEERPVSSIANNARRANDFLYRESGDGYHDDREGLRCPLGAHVRRANPRDALPGGAERVMRHRIIRRGMPYGDPAKGEEVGLAFVCYSASIADGFEFIQRQWLNVGTALGLGARECDLLLHPGRRVNPAGMVIPRGFGETVVLPPPDEPFAIVKGCLYLFVPSRRACAWLVDPHR
jgi:Dyp-type peroxidase family